MTRCILPAVACCLLSLASAQSLVVVPAPAAIAAGDATNAFPWGTTAAGWPGLRILTTYGETNFSGQGISRPILITGLKWRPDENANPVPGGTFANATIRMSTSPVGHAGVTTYFPGNHGADLTTVFNGTVTCSPTPGSSAWTQQSWCVQVTLQTPFVYDPLRGDIVVDVDYTSSAFSGGGVAGMDMQTANANGSRVYASGAYPAANNLGQTMIPVLGLVYSDAYATSTSFGAGCNGQQVAESFYESISSYAFDLSARTVRMVGDATGYHVDGTPVPMHPYANAQQLQLGSSGAITMPLASGWIPDGHYGQHHTLTVGVDGYVALGTNNINGFMGASNVLSAPYTGWYCHHDFDPTLPGSGQVRWEETATHVYVTWDDVISSGGGAGSTFQFQFEKNTPNVTLVFGSVAQTGSPYVVAFSQGGYTPNAASPNLSNALTTGFHVDFAQQPLTLYPAYRPLLGGQLGLGTTFVPANAPFGLCVIGLQGFATGISLTGIGMLGCFQHTTQDVLVPFVPHDSIGFTTLGLPANQAYNGMHFYAQSLVLAPGANPLGALTSNAVDLRLGIR